MLTNYINSHKIYRIKGYTSIQTNDIKNGTIIRFDYSESKNNKRPHVFVLNKKYFNLLHGLVIDYMSLLEFDRFINMLVAHFHKNVPLVELLNTHKMIDTKLLYETKIGKFLGTRVKQNVYRTYKRNIISDIKLVDYVL